MTAADAAENRGFVEERDVEHRMIGVQLPEHEGQEQHDAITNAADDWGRSNPRPGPR